MAMLSKNVAKGTHLMIKLPLNFLTPAVKNRHKKALMNESLQPRDIYTLIFFKLNLLLQRE